MRLVIRISKKLIKTFSLYIPYLISNEITETRAIHSLLLPYVLIIFPLNFSRQTVLHILRPSSFSFISRWEQHCRKIDIFGSFSSIIPFHHELSIDSNFICLYCMEKDLFYRKINILTLFLAKLYLSF